MRMIPVAASKNVWVAAMVSDEDYQYLSQFTWRLDPHGYAQRQVYSHRSTGVKKYSHYRRFMMHREVMGITDSRVRLDHRNRNRLDNQRSNLRIASAQQNNFNNGGKPGQRKSRYKGVSPADSTQNPWRANIFDNGKQQHLGCFATEEDAARAYNDFARKLHGEFAFQNEVSE